NEYGESSDDVIGDLDGGDVAGPAPRGQDEKERISGRPETEQVRPVRIVPGADELGRGEEIGACIAEPQRLEPEVRRRREASAERQEKDEDSCAAAQARGGLRLLSGVERQALSQVGSGRPPNNICIVFPGRWPQPIPQALPEVELALLQDRLDPGQELVGVGAVDQAVVEGEGEITDR